MEKGRGVNFEIRTSTAGKIPPRKIWVITGRLTKERGLRSQPLAAVKTTQ